MTALILAVLLNSPVPITVHFFAKFVNDEGGKGWCTPLPGHRMLTAAHLVGREHARWTTQNGTTGTMTLQWKDTDRDLAMYVLDGNEALSTVPLAKHLPESGEQVFARFYVSPGMVPSVTVGRYLAQDSEGRVQLDMYDLPGGSGSGVVNEKGELIAVVSGLSVLEGDFPYRSIIRAIPVAGSFPAPSKKAKQEAEDAKKPAGE